MTNKAIQFFFMASISVIHEGKLLTRFNTISAVNNINITAAVLDMVQQGAAQMVQQQEVEFTDLVIENIFCLTPLGCTEEEFTKGTQLADQLAGAAAEASELAADADASAQAEEALSAQVHESVDTVRDTLQDAVNEAVAEDHAAAEATIGQTGDLSELDAQTLEETSVADVTTADVKSQD